VWKTAPTLGIRRCALWMFPFSLLTPGNIRSPCDNPLWTDDRAAVSQTRHADSRNTRAWRVRAHYEYRTRHAAGNTTQARRVLYIRVRHPASEWTGPPNPYPHRDRKNQNGRPNGQTFGLTPTAGVLPFSVLRHPENVALEIGNFPRGTRDSTLVGSTVSWPSSPQHVDHLVDDRLLGGAKTK
jgi:hypothetical protein